MNCLYKIYTDLYGRGKLELSWKQARFGPEWKDTVKARGGGRGGGGGGGGEGVQTAPRRSTWCDPKQYERVAGWPTSSLTIAGDIGAAL